MIVYRLGKNHIYTYMIFTSSLNVAFMIKESCPAHASVARCQRLKHKIGLVSLPNR